MFGPGRYVPDPTEGISNVNDLPAPQRGFYRRTISKRPVLAVVSSPLVTNPASAPCMTSAIYPPAVPLTSWWPTRLIIAHLSQAFQH